MSFVAVAIVGGAAVAGGASMYAANKAGKAATSAAGTQAAGQREQLDYLKEREAMPQQFREEALTKLGGLAGLEGGEGSQLELIERAKESPLYKAILEGRESGEESILRSASATGGLRSGNVQENLYDYNVNLEREALLKAFEEEKMGLQGLAGLPSGAREIGGVMAGIGETEAAGQLSAAQAYQQGIQGVSTAVGTGTGQFLKYRGI